jgi:hypothetical protein
MLTSRTQGGEAVKKLKRMNINIEASLHDQFKAATAVRGENMTDVLLRFIEQYVDKNRPQPPRGEKRRP